MRPTVATQPGDEPPPPAEQRDDLVSSRSKKPVLEHGKKQVATSTEHAAVQPGSAEMGVLALEKDEEAVPAPELGSSSGDAKEDSGGAGNETDVEDEDGEGDDSGGTGDSGSRGQSRRRGADGGVPAGGAAMYPFPSTEGHAAGSAAHLHYHHLHRRHSSNSHAPPSSAEVLLSSATSASSAADDDYSEGRHVKRRRLKSLELAQVPRLKRVGALGISVHSDDDIDDPAVSGLDTIERRPELRRGDSTTDTRETDLGISSGEFKTVGNGSPLNPKRRRPVADATFRGVVDELVLQNRQLRDRLKRYEAGNVSTDLKHERLFEIRFFEGLPPCVPFSHVKLLDLTKIDLLSEKRFEVEDYLTRYVQDYARASMQPDYFDLADPAMPPERRAGDLDTAVLAGPSNSGVEPVSFSGTGHGMRLPAAPKQLPTIPLPPLDLPPIDDPAEQDVAREIVVALEDLFRTSLVRTSRARSPPTQFPDAKKAAALNASNESYFANLLAHDFLSQGFVYLNLAITMGQLHRFNVTVTFVQRAIKHFSDRLELSEDGGRIRWKGPRDEVPQAQGDALVEGVLQHDSPAAMDADGASSSNNALSRDSGSRDPSSKETVLSGSSGAASSSRDPSSRGTNLFDQSVAPSSRTGETSQPSLGRNSAPQQDKETRPVRPAASVLQPPHRQQTAAQPTQAPRSPVRAQLQPQPRDSQASKVVQVSSPSQRGGAADSSIDTSDKLSVANLEHHNQGQFERELRHEAGSSTQSRKLSAATGPPRDGAGALVFYGNGLFCSDLTKEEDGPVTPPALPEARRASLLADGILGAAGGQHESDRPSGPTTGTTGSSNTTDTDAAMLEVEDGRASSSLARDAASSEQDGSGGSSLKRLRMSGMTPNLPADFFTLIVQTRHPSKRDASAALPTPDTPGDALPTRAPSFSCIPPEAKRPRLASTPSVEIVSTREIYHDAKILSRKPIGLEFLEEESASHDGNKRLHNEEYGHLLTSSNLAKHALAGPASHSHAPPPPAYLPPTPSPPHDDYLLSLASSSHAWAPPQAGFHSSRSPTTGVVASKDRSTRPARPHARSTGVRFGHAESTTTTALSTGDERPISLDDFVDFASPRRQR
ncbi:hypothetical protein Rhopal_004007-T1 [Rhodotorula paludigena]|uniref:Frequency clock protein n=1 Tax=Rhodotorula paludigena TaxID=86838 RepID=A0AAV5GLB4_9BASI|nr:hypothetical protein Rhopal_004007-T1 [Rhodotorula paludigena]